jgi:mRNA interferase MazF
MEEFVKKDIVIVQFPFSNLTNTKKRPALVIHSGQDILLVQITSKTNKYSTKRK